MKAQETLTLIRPHGTSIWRTAGCVLWSRPTRHPRAKKGSKGQVDDVVLNIEATGKAMEGSEEYTPTPCATVAWFMSPFTADLLLGKVFEIPKAYDERVRDHLVDMVYFEHMDVDENRVEFLARDRNRFHVRWTGIMEDPSPPDSSNPNPTMKVIADFSAELVER